jgi:hypothetical protein
VSVREAIRSFNQGNDLGDPNITSQNPGTYGTNDRVNFNIPGSGVQTINVGTDPSAAGIAEPTITKPMTIDGTTQPSTLPIAIALNGTGAGAGATGLDAEAQVTITGLDLENFGGPAIRLSSFFFFLGSDGSTVQGNYIGTAPTGTSAAGNGAGVEVFTTNNTIAGNVISANGAAGGVSVSGDHNTVRGNRIGTNAAGTAEIGNLANTSGGAVSLSGNDNTVGGSTAAARNVISGNAERGVIVIGRNNTIAGNFIGTDAGGTKPVPNLGDGVGLNGAAQTVSGIPGAPQRIWFNGGAGIRDSANGDRFTVNSIQGNGGGGIAVAGSTATGSLALSPNRKTVTVAFGGATLNGVVSAEVFDNPKLPVCPGQGVTFVGGATVPASATGTGRITVPLGKALPVGDGVTATLTDQQRGTSPFVCLPGGVRASNVFSFGVKAGSKGKLTITIHGPGAGTYAAKATTKTKAGKKVPYGKRSASAGGAGPLKIKIRPGKKARKALAAGRTLAVSVAVTFSPQGGTPRTKTAPVKVKLK